MGLFDFLKKKPAEPTASTPATPATPAESTAPAQAVGGAAALPEAAGPTAARAGVGPAAPGAEPPAFVEGVDAFGRRVRVSRDEYRQKLLPELLKAHGSDPERLCMVILQALRDGCAADVLAAANRLTAVDRDVDRALSVLAVVQRDAGEPEAAAATLHELLQKRPQSAAARVGLGMLAHHRGDDAEAESMLWEALQFDSNHPDAVHGWLQLRHRAVGDAGYAAEVDRAAALPGAWRAPLWRARLSLQRGDGDAAAAIYREVLARVPDAGVSDALVMASGDLVQQQRHDLVRELVAPRFVPGRHHPHVGLALLQHHLQQQDHAAGAALLHAMYLHYGHIVGADLQPFTAAFDRLRLSRLPPPPPLSPTARLGLYRLDRPVWYAGLEDPVWLLPTKGADARSVLCFALAVEGTAGLPAGREEELGRLTRSVPLWLAEQVWLSTPHRGTAVLPMAENGGWAVLGRPWPEDQLVQQVPPDDRDRSLLITGVLRVDGDRRRIDLWVYDCGRGQRLGHAATEGTTAELGRMLLQLMAELWPVLGGPAGHRPPVGDEAHWARYADALGQHAALVVTQAGGMSKERLYGERYITQWLQQTALQEPRWQPGFWLFTSALAVLNQLGSPIPKEHARVVAELFRQAPPGSAFARLGVRALRACGLEAVWQARRREIAAAATDVPQFLAWLPRAEAAR